MAKLNKSEQEDQAPKTFTFVDRGPLPVRKVNVHGTDFFLGKAAEVTDPALIKVLEGNPCFVEGEVTPEDLASYTEAATKAEAIQRAKDKKLNAEVMKIYGKE